MSFRRILVGCDGSESSLHAAQLVDRLRSPGGHMLVVTVAETQYAMYAGFEAPEWDRRVRTEAECTREAVRRTFAEDYHVDEEVVTGRADHQLLAAAAEFRADLIAIGSSGQGRAAGIILGSVATHLIHEAPCSVFVAHGDVQPALFPRSIIVGVDGSAPSERARRVADELGTTLGVPVRMITATGGKPLHDGIVAGAEVDPRSPVDALVESSSHDDLVVVGSRGLHGLPALGSVAERVAHASECPVLVVRGSY